MGCRLFLKKVISGSHNIFGYVGFGTSWI